VYAWPCAKSQAETYSVAHPPDDSTWICNVCAAELTAQAEENPSTLVLSSMTEQLEESIKNISDMTNRPMTEVFNRFLEWKLGRPMRTTPIKSPLKKEEK
jgi:hypothetical protein